MAALLVVDRTMVRSVWRQRPAGGRRRRRHEHRVAGRLAGRRHVVVDGGRHVRRRCSSAAGGGWGTTASRCRRWCCCRSSRSTAPTPTSPTSPSSRRVLGGIVGWRSTPSSWRRCTSTSRATPCATSPRGSRTCSGTSPTGCARGWDADRARALVPPRDRPGRPCPRGAAGRGDRPREHPVELAAPAAPGPDRLGRLRAHRRGGAPRPVAGGRHRTHPRRRRRRRGPAPGAVRGLAALLRRRPRRGGEGDLALRRLDRRLARRGEAARRAGPSRRSTR